MFLDKIVIDTNFTSIKYTNPDTNITYCTHYLLIKGEIINIYIFIVCNHDNN